MSESFPGAVGTLPANRPPLPGVGQPPVAPVSEKDLAAKRLQDDLRLIGVPFEQFKLEMERRWEAYPKLVQLVKDLTHSTTLVGHVPAMEGPKTRAAALLRDLKETPAG